MKIQYLPFKEFTLFENKDDFNTMRRYIGALIRACTVRCWCTEERLELILNMSSPGIASCLMKYSMVWGSLEYILC